jgi:hypothetical protein
MHPFAHPFSKKSRDAKLIPFNPPITESPINFFKLT